MALQPGRKVFINLDMNDVGGTGASWQRVAQQRDGGNDRSSETVDGRVKEDEGWPKNIVTGLTWSVSCEGAMEPNDDTLIHLKDRWRAQEGVFIQIDRRKIGGISEEGPALITKYSEGFSNNQLVSYTLELTGNGPLVVSPII